MTNQGFYYNQTACVGCKTCQIACKDKNDLPMGLLFRNVTDFEVGEFPTAKVYHYAASCNHCESPACVEVCPNMAYYINQEDGTIQHDDAKCIGCQYCVNACPYEVPKYDKDLQISRKCDACYVLRNNDEQPACVAACPMRALDFGPIDELREKYGETVDEIVILPEASQTGPSLAIEALDAARDPNPVFLLA